MDATDCVHEDEKLAFDTRITDLCEIARAVASTGCGF
jgi:hypothetical protein